MTIKHLVISGGGPTAIKSLGSLKYLHEHGIWNIKDIKSIYATSAGVIISVLLLLEFEFDIIVNYIIHRPWHEVYKIRLDDIVGAYTRKGILDEHCVDVFFMPFFKAKDIDINITLEEFFNMTRVNLHIMTFELNEFKTVNISHKTHPHLLLKTAVKMSLSIPILFTPVCIEDKCYIDGGIRCNYPLDECIQGENITDTCEIFGIRSGFKMLNSPITEDSNILDFILKFIKKLVSIDKVRTCIENEIVHDMYSDTISLFTNALHSMEFRKELLECGIQSAIKVVSPVKTELNCL